MNIPVCSTCTHFRQHYNVDEDWYMSVNCGHCNYPRLKHREPNTRACEHYERRASPSALPNRNHVVHFLTTKMLQHILDLPLPPEQVDKK